MKKILLISIIILILVLSSCTQPLNMGDVFIVSEVYEHGSSDLYVIVIGTTFLLNDSHMPFNTFKLYTKTLPEWAEVGNKIEFISTDKPMRHNYER